MIIATFSCGHIDIAPSPLLLSLVEVLDAASAAAHAGGDDTYAAYYQAGAVTHEIIGAAQIDRRGRVNNLAIRRRNGAMLRLPGQGGMADVANMHRDYALYVPRHTKLAFVEAVDLASSGRGLARSEERVRAGYRPGSARVFTDLCVFRLDEESGELVVDETDARRDTRGRDGRRRASLSPSPPIAGRSRCPTRRRLDILRHRIDPLGLRKLEFVAARERGDLIAAIIAADRDLVARLGRTTA